MNSTTVSKTHRQSLSFKHMLCEGCASSDFSSVAQLLHNEPRACACGLPGLPGEGHCIKRGVKRCSAKRRAAVSTERSARLVKPQCSAAELRFNVTQLAAAPDGKIEKFSGVEAS